MELVDINPTLDRMLYSCWDEKQDKNGVIAHEWRRSPWRRWRPPTLTGKTKILMRVLKAPVDAAQRGGDVVFDDSIEVKIRVLDGIEYFNLMGWQGKHWKPVRPPFNKWASDPFSSNETMLNLAGNAFSPFAWVAVQIALLTVRGYYCQQGEVAPAPETVQPAAEREPRFEDSSSASESPDDE